MGGCLGLILGFAMLILARLAFLWGFTHGKRRIIADTGTLKWRGPQRSANHSFRPIVTPRLSLFVTLWPALLVTHDLHHLSPHHYPLSVTPRLVRGVTKGEVVVG